MQYPIFPHNDQWFNLTANDMKTTLVNAGMEYHEPEIIHGTSLPNSTSPPSPAPMRSPIHLKLTPCDSTSTTTLVNKTCPVNTSCDHLPHLDHPNISSELTDNSTVGITEPECILDPEDIFQLGSISISSQATCSIETEFLPEFEGQLDHTNLSLTDVFSGHHEFLPEFEGKLDHTNLSPTDVFSGHYDYGLFLLQKEIDAPHDDISHEDTHVYEEQDQDVILTHATILSHTFALLQFMDQHNC